MKIKNKGTGAGGKNTNLNGLNHEENTKKNTTENELIKIKKSNFQKFLIEKEYLKNKLEAHGCKQPDEVYLNENEKILFVIEKKFQQQPGSVCEKLQTGVFKREYLQENLPDLKVIYIYCLSSWFENNCRAELRYLKKNKIPYLFSNKEDYQVRLDNLLKNIE